MRSSRWLAAVAASAGFSLHRQALAGLHPRTPPAARKWPNFRRDWCRCCTPDAWGCSWPSFPIPSTTPRKTAPTWLSLKSQFAGISAGGGSAAPLLGAPGGAGVFGRGGPRFLQYRPAPGVLFPGGDPLGHRADRVFTLPTAAAGRNGLNSGKTARPAMITCMGRKN